MSCEERYLQLASSQQLIYNFTLNFEHILQKLAKLLLKIFSINLLSVLSL